MSWGPDAITIEKPADATSGQTPKATGALQNLKDIQSGYNAFFATRLDGSFVAWGNLYSVTQDDYFPLNHAQLGLTAEQITLWLEHTDLATLINRKGTTWRALSDDQKQSADNVSEAIALMVQNPSLIKRPVLQIQNNDQITRLHTGFQPDLYAGIFSDTP